MLSSKIIHSINDTLMSFVEHGVVIWLVVGPSFATVNNAIYVPCIVSYYPCYHNDIEEGLGTEAVYYDL